MAPKNKPIFLKTFSELTIQELRSLPVSQVFSLFFQEVKATFTQTPAVKKVKRGRPPKKKVTKHIFTTRLKPPKFNPYTSFHITIPRPTVNYSRVTEVLKRVFILEPYTYTSEPREVIEQTVREAVTEREAKRKKLTKQIEVPAIRESAPEASPLQVKSAMPETVVFSKSSL